MLNKFQFLFSDFPYFFFQEEDGIRYRDVTGVQTCALPISSANSSTARPPKAQTARNDFLSNLRRPTGGARAVCGCSGVPGRNGAGAAGRPTGSVQPQHDAD